MDSQRDRRADMLRTGDIPKTLISLAIPSIIGMVANGIYNVVDTIFVGRLGTSAVGAVAVAFPFFMLISSIGIAVGMGGASYTSRVLGQERTEEGRRTIITAVAMVIAAGTLLSILGQIWLEPILRLFGATDTILPYAVSYARVFVLGSPILMVKMTLNNLLRSEGSAKAAMAALITGAGLNIVLDPLFIFTLGMGITGAAVATIVSQLVAVTYQLWYYWAGRSLLTLGFAHLKPSKTIVTQIVKIGLPLLLTQGLNSLAMALINVAASPYGDAAVASMGIVKRVMMLGIFALIGFSQGFQPLAGFNYGARQYDRLKEAIVFAVKVSTGFTLIIAALFFGFADTVISWFSRDPEVIRIGSLALRAYSIPFPLLGFQLIYFSLFQALGKALPAGVLSVSRQGLLLIPAVLLLPQYFGLYGVIASQPVADALTIVMTGALAIGLNRQLNRERDQYQANLADTATAETPAAPAAPAAPATRPASAVNRSSSQGQSTSGRKQARKGEVVG